MGIFGEKYTKKRLKKALKVLKERDFPMESPAPLLQRYNIFRLKTNCVKTADYLKTSITCNVKASY